MSAVRLIHPAPWSSAALAASLWLASGSAGAQEAAKPPAEGSQVIRKVIEVGKRPESVVRGFGGKLYVSVMNTPEASSDGVIKVLDGDTPRDFATELDEPKGLCFSGKLLFVTDVKRVWKIDAKGAKSLLADEDDFPEPPSFLNDITCEAGGKAVYVSDTGANKKMRDPQGKLWPLDAPAAKELPAIGRVYRIDLAGKVSVVVDKNPQMPCPNGVSFLSKWRLLVTEFFTGTIYEARGGALTALTTGLRGADGVEKDRKGNIYVSSWELGKVWRLPPAKGKQPAEPALIAEGFQSAADFFLDQKAGVLVLPDMKAGTLTFLPLPR
jgi:sugar lactone lactonase YvrE